MRQEVLLDTDTLSYYFRGNEEVYLNISAYTESYSFINISIITYYEIVSGLKFRHSKNRLKQFYDFAKENCMILPLTTTSANISAEIYSNLRLKGTPVDDIDLLIAGIAIENDLAIVTNNQKHFGKIEQLKMENWTK